MDRLCILMDSFPSPIPRKRSGTMGQYFLYMNFDVGAYWRQDVNAGSLATKLYDPHGRPVRVRYELILWFTVNEIVHDNQVFATTIRNIILSC